MWSAACHDGGSDGGTDFIGDTDVQDELEQNLISSLCTTHFESKITKSILQRIECTGYEYSKLSQMSLAPAGSKILLWSLLRAEKKPNNAFHYINTSL